MIEALPDPESENLPDEIINIEGVLRRIIEQKDGAPKTILVQTQSALIVLRVAKPIRELLERRWTEGGAIHGKVVEEWKKGRLRKRLVDIRFPSDPDFQPFANGPTLQICQGKSCRKNGSKQLLQSIRAAAAERGIAADVLPCSCLDHCKRGPNALTFDGRVIEGLTVERALRLLDQGTLQRD